MEKAGALLRQRPQRWSATAPASNRPHRGHRDPVQGASFRRQLLQTILSPGLSRGSRQILQKDGKTRSSASRAQPAARARHVEVTGP